MAALLRWEWVAGVKPRAPPFLRALELQEPSGEALITFLSSSFSRRKIDTQPWPELPKVPQEHSLHCAAGTLRSLGPYLRGVLPPSWGPQRTQNQDSRHWDPLLLLQSFWVAPQKLCSMVWLHLIVFCPMKDRVAAESILESEEWRYDFTVQFVLPFLVKLELEFSLSFAKYLKNFPTLIHHQAYFFPPNLLLFEYHVAPDSYRHRVYICTV